MMQSILVLISIRCPETFIVLDAPLLPSLCDASSDCHASYSEWCRK